MLCSNHVVVNKYDIVQVFLLHVLSVPICCGTVRSFMMLFYLECKFIVLFIYGGVVKNIVIYF
jgi:hypothetical protein